MNLVNTEFHGGYGTQNGSEPKPQSNSLYSPIIGGAGCRPQMLVCSLATSGLDQIPGWTEPLFEMWPKMGEVSQVQLIFRNVHHFGPESCVKSSRNTVLSNPNLNHGTRLALNRTSESNAKSHPDLNTTSLT